MLGAGLALLYAPRTGEETRRVLQRKLWKLRAMTEEKLDEIAQQFGGGKEALDGRWTMTRTRTSTTTGETPRVPAAGAGAIAARGARAPSGRVARPAAGGRRPRGAARLKRLRPGGWHRSPAGFLRRTLQAADENNIPFLASALTFDALLAAVPFVLLVLIGLTHLAQAVAGGPAVDTDRTCSTDSSRPTRDRRAATRSRVIERLLTGITENRGQISLYAAAGVHLVQHPAVRRRPHLAQRHLRRVRAAAAAAAIS